MTPRPRIPRPEEIPPRSALGIACDLDRLTWELSELIDNVQSPSARRDIAVALGELERACDALDSAAWTLGERDRVTDTG